MKQSKEQSRSDQADLLNKYIGRPWLQIQPSTAYVLRDRLESEAGTIYTTSRNKAKNNHVLTRRTYIMKNIGRLGFKFSTLQLMF